MPDHTFKGMPHHFAEVEKAIDRDPAARARIVRHAKEIPAVRQVNNLITQALGHARKGDAEGLWDAGRSIEAAEAESAILEVALSAVQGMIADAKAHLQSRTPRIAEPEPEPAEDEKTKPARTRKPARGEPAEATP